MPSETTETLELPAVPERPSDRYTLRSDHAVAEVSLRLLGVRLVRVRLRARGGDLVLAGGATDREPVATIEIELLARPVRSGPVAAFLLRDVPRRRRFTFTAVDVDLPTGPRPAPLDGEVIVRGSAGESWSLPLTARIVPSDEDTILLAAHGPIRPSKAVRSGLGAVGRWLWLDAAVEFAR